MMKKGAVIASIIVALMLFAGCTGTGPGPPPAVKLAVINHDMTKGESGGVEVRVRVKNTGPVVAELAEVTVSFYDADKNLIESSTDSVMNLRPGETWAFKIACQGTRCIQVKRYEIETMAGTSSGGL